MYRYNTHRPYKNLIGTNVSRLSRRWVWKSEENNVLHYRNIVFPKILYQFKVDSNGIIEDVKYIEE